LQQPRVWKYMPPEWRNARKGQVTNITSPVKGGFTEAKFVAPNAIGLHLPQLCSRSFYN
jgi:hypothetical protein